jgi:hypothetical protein
VSLIEDTGVKCVSFFASGTARRNSLLRSVGCVKQLTILELPSRASFHVEPGTFWYPDCTQALPREEDDDERDKG